MFRKRKANSARQSEVTSSDSKLIVLPLSLSHFLRELGQAGCQEEEANAQRIGRSIAGYRRQSGHQQRQSVAGQAAGQQQLPGSVAEQQQQPGDHRG